MAAIKTAIYEPPARGLPLLAVAMHGKDTFAIQVKSRTDGEAWLEQQRAILTDHELLTQRYVQRQKKDSGVPQS